MDISLPKQGIVNFLKQLHGSFTQIFLVLLSVAFFKNGRL